MDIFSHYCLKSVVLVSSKLVRREGGITCRTATIQLRRIYLFTGISCYVLSLLSPFLFEFITVVIFRNDVHSQVSMLHFLLLIVFF